MQKTPNLGLSKPEGNEWADVEYLNQNADKIDSAIASKADKSIEKSATLLASSWIGDTAPYYITITVEEATATNIIEINPTPEQSEEEYDIMSEALIDGYSQTTGSITLVARGEKPTIDLPIELVIRGDM